MTHRRDLENFALLDEWDDRYRYVIELGRTCAPLPESAHIDANKVQGCASQVWLRHPRQAERRRRAGPQSSKATATRISCAG